MENLGSLDPNQMLQLFVGSLVCAFVILLFIIIYVVMARRSSRSKERTGGDMGGLGQGVLSSRDHLQSSAPSVSTTSGSLSAAMVNEKSAIDVSARLAGTGREAWLEEPSPSASDIPFVGEPAPYHAQEVLRLGRDSSTGQVWIQMAGVRYRNLNDIRDRAVGQQVMAAITHLLRFSNGMVATDQGVARLELPACDAVKVPAAFGALSEEHGPDEIMRLMSGPDQDDFCVHLLDRCYRRLVDVSDRTVGQCVLEGITRLLQFSNGMLATNNGIGVVPVPSLSVDVHTPLPVPPTLDSRSSQSAPSFPSLLESDWGHHPPAPVSPTSRDELLSEEERFLRQLINQVPQQPQKPVERPGLRSSLRRMRGKSPAEPLPSLDLVDEIDRIFQSKLAASTLAATDAKVESHPDGGVRIRVGTVYYDSPDDVPDPYLRDMLKLSIAEWEQS
jgi:hypothetical protein